MTSLTFATALEQFNAEFAPVRIPPIAPAIYSTLIRHERHPANCKRRQPATPRRIGPLERLIAGPQGDPTLKADFYSFLGCIACGTGLALVLVAIVMAGRVLLGGAQ